ncbi:MAG: DUF1351 domain-containing protein [Bacilli bacterium]|jgi:hypothetical protein|nr:DUF1351 domain-containing protein [Bacilli bacterium]
MEELNLNEIVKIEQMPKVFEQLELIGSYVDEQLKDLDKLECTDKNKQEIKDRRTTINNTLNLLESKRKEIKNKLNEPYDLFNKKYEETTKIKLQEASKTLTEKINKIEDEQKLKKRQEVERYFSEYVASKEIDFVKFEQLNLNITLSVSEKNLKEQVKTFVDRIVDDLLLISSQEHKEEILLEYKKTLNVSGSISSVLNRYKELEELKKKEEEKAQKQEQVKENVQRIERIITPPTRANIEEQEEALEIAFKVRGNREKLKALVNFLKDGGYEYEQF